MASCLRSLPAWALALSMATFGVGCQAVFGDFHVDDSAFGGAAGAQNSGGGLDGKGGGGSKGGASGTGGGDTTEVQTGPIFVSPTKGLFTTEWGGQATFSVRLLQKPSDIVTIPLSSDDTNEGRVSPARLTFNGTDWNAPQVVTVTGVDDTVTDRNKDYHVVTGAAMSTDKAFAAVDAIDVTLTNVDDETAGVTVAPTAGLITSESGAQDTFTVVLNSKPAQDVTIALSSKTPAEGAVSPTSLVFTAVNWMAPQLVTVTGVDDPGIDGTQAYVIETSATSSDDPSYKGIEVPDVSVNNLDNETPGVTTTLVAGIDPIDRTKLRTSESGDTATFTVELNAPPTADVTIPIATDAADEAQLSPASLTFTKLNWNAPQTVTVMGLNDDVADGDQPYKVVIGAATSADKQYEGLDATDLDAANVDNDKPGFSIMLVSGIDPNDSSKLLTTEAGITATFTIALNSMPLKPVTIPLSSSNLGEGIVTPSSITFSTVNWKAPQTVSVKGVDDKVHDGNQLFFVRTGMATSEDPGYVLDPPDVQVSNEDNDSPGVKISLAGGIDPLNPAKLVTGENGDTASFTVALTSQPTADVSITLVSNNTKEGTVSPTTLKFTSANYGAAQTVSITGVDDKVQDGNQPYVIAVGATSSKDPDFNLKFGTQVQVTNRDNDTAGIIVAPLTGLTTSEAGKTATFTIQLQSQPTADVSIGLSSSDPAEGKPNVSSVKFTNLNWNAPQTITVTGQQDDNTADGDVVYKIITDPPTSADPNYGPTKMNPPDVALTNIDDDTAGIIVAPIAGLSTTEAGGQATFTIVLQSKPGANVKINLSSSKLTEGTVSPASLTFTNANYNSPQVVTVTGVDDAAQDGNQAYLIVTALSSSTDPKYNGIKPKDVSVTNIDNDSAGVRLNPTPNPINPPANTTEKGGTSTFTVVLTSLPSAVVTVAVSSTNTNEGTVSSPLLTFTTANWNAPQTVTVTGVDDKVADGDQPYKVRLADAVSTDANYNARFAIDVPFSNVDDDRPGYVINAAAMLQTKEDGTQATFTVSLLSQPTAAVSVGLSSSNTDEGKVSPATLSFNPSNWATPQIVTITGQQDDVADGPQGYTIQIANAGSIDANYGGKFATSVPLTNLDDDQPGFVVVAASGLQTTEKGGMATFTVALLSKPAGTATVTLGVSSSNVKEGTVSAPSLVFTTANWNIPQTVTVTGVDDKKADGLQVYAVNFAPAVSADSGYANKAPGSVPLANVDDDQANIIVTPTTCSTTPTSTAAFTIVLTSQPVGDVTISLMSDTPTAGSVSPGAVTFTSDTWNIEQSVTVTGLADGTMGVMTSYQIVTSIASAPMDPSTYNGFPVADVTCTNSTP